MCQLNPNRFSWYMGYIFCDSFWQKFPGGEFQIGFRVRKLNMAYNGEIRKPKRIHTLPVTQLRLVTLLYTSSIFFLGGNLMSENQINEDLTDVIDAWYEGLPVKRQLAEQAAWALVGVVVGFAADRSIRMGQSRLRRFQYDRAMAKQVQS